MTEVRYSVAVTAWDDLGPSAIVVFQPIPGPHLEELVGGFLLRIRQGREVRIETEWGAHSHENELVERIMRALQHDAPIDLRFEVVNHAQPDYRGGRLRGFREGPISYRFGPPREEARA